jgi:Gas vesicle synthesis protein GvpL/GvpF
MQATYLYCVVASAARPTVPRGLKGLPATGRVRLLDVERGLFLVVADAPLSRYGEAAINRGLSDLNWVSRAAVAHESVIEAFIDETAVLPMKLFTLFTSDERAIEHVRLQKTRIAALVKRLGKHHEWGLRIVLDRARVPKPPAKRARSTSAPGVAYLARKKAQRDAAAELTAHARETVAALYDRFAGRSRLARRRSASELPAGGAALLLDAAFLVPKTRARSFRAQVEREARSLASHGYGVTLTGPWPPYSFVQD